MVLRWFLQEHVILNIKQISLKKESFNNINLPDIFFYISGLLVLFRDASSKTSFNKEKLNKMRIMNNI